MALSGTSSGKLALLWIALLTGLSSCSSYDPSLIAPPRDAVVRPGDATIDGDAADADGQVEEGPDCVELPAGSACAPATIASTWAGSAADVSRVAMEPPLYLGPLLPRRTCRRIRLT